MFDNDNNNINYWIPYGTNTWDSGVFQIAEINNKRTILKNLQLNDYKNYDKISNQDNLNPTLLFGIISNRIVLDVSYQKSYLFKIISNNIETIWIPEIRRNINPTEKYFTKNVITIKNSNGEFLLQYDFVDFASTSFARIFFFVKKVVRNILGVITSSDNVSNLSLIFQNIKYETNILKLNTFGNQSTNTSISWFQDTSNKTPKTFTLPTKPTFVNETAWIRLLYNVINPFNDASLLGFFDKTYSVLTKVLTSLPRDFIISEEYQIFSLATYQDKISQQLRNDYSITQDLDTPISTTINFLPNSSDSNPNYHNVPTTGYLTSKINRNFKYETLPDVVSSANIDGNLKN
jgi:hypothetical protein